MPPQANRVEPVVLAEGLGFTEGPLWTDDGRLWVTSVSRGLLYEVGGAAVAEPGGNPSGLCQDAAGTIWIAQGGNHSRTRSARPVVAGIQRVRGDVDDVVTAGVHAPNDCAVGPDGAIWFTDPVGEAMAADGPAGCVRALDPATGVVSVKAGDIAYPNGLVFFGERFYVAETRTRRILEYRVAGGDLEFAGVLATVDDGHPDGLAVGSDGTIYAAGTDSHAVHGFDPNGREVERIQLPDGSFPTNLCFGGPELRTLFITAAAGGRVWSVPRAVPGAAV